MQTSAKQLHSGRSASSRDCVAMAATWPIILYEGVLPMITASRGKSKVTFVSLLLLFLVDGQGLKFSDKQDRGSWMLL